MPLRHERVRAIADHQRVYHQRRNRLRSQSRRGIGRRKDAPRHPPPIRVEASSAIRTIR